MNQHANCNIQRWEDETTRTASDKMDVSCGAPDCLVQPKRAIESQEHDVRAIKFNTFSTHRRCADDIPTQPKRPSGDEIPSTPSRRQTAEDSECLRSPKASTRDISKLSKSPQLSKLRRQKELLELKNNL